MYYEEAIIQYDDRSDLVEELNELRKNDYKLINIIEEKKDGFFEAWCLFEVWN